MSSSYLAAVLLSALLARTESLCVKNFMEVGSENKIYKSDFFFITANSQIEVEAKIPNGSSLTLEVFTKQCEKVQRVAQIVKKSLSTGSLHIATLKNLIPDEFPGSVGYVAITIERPQGSQDNIRVDYVTYTYKGDSDDSDKKCYDVKNNEKNDTLYSKQKYMVAKYGNMCSEDQQILKLMRNIYYGSSFQISLKNINSNLASISTTGKDTLISLDETIISKEGTVTLYFSFREAKVCFKLIRTEFGQKNTIFERCNHVRGREPNSCYVFQDFKVKQDFVGKIEVKVTNVESEELKLNEITYSAQPLKDEGRQNECEKHK